MDNSAIAPTFDVDPFAPEVLRDPYDYYRQLRALGPVAYIPRYDFYVASGHAEARRVMQDWESFTSEAGTGLSDIRKPGAWRPGGPIVETDPPRHSNVRGVMNRILSPLVVKTWGDKFKAEGDRLVERVVARGRFDAVSDIAEGFVLKVFPEVLGLEINRDQAVAVGHMNFNAIGPKNANFEASLKEVEPILGWWQKAMQRESMIPGGFGEKIFQAEEAGELTPGTSSGLIMSFLRGGMDTTVSAIGSALWLLATHQDQWTLLRNEPNRVRAVFDEAIRYESPIQTIFRTTTAPQSLGDCRLDADKKVAIAIGAANRDPSKWQKPDQFDITRQAVGHLALGAGIHLCIGQMIARLEFESVLAPFVKRVATVALDGIERPEHRANNTLRTLASLPLQVTPA